MSALSYIFLPAVAGIGLGALYFGGLWFTLRRLVTVRRPALFILTSYLGRLAVCFLGFLAVARVGQWQGLLVALATFLLARVVIVRSLGKPALSLEKERGSDDR